MTNAMPVLLVEDDTVDVLTVRRAFRDLGYPNPIVHASDGEEALKYLVDAQAVRPFLVLLDLNMPRMGGLEFLARVKDDAELQTLPIVVLSTSGENRDVVNSYRLGASGYLVKPVDYGQFVEVIQVIQRYWTQNELPREADEVLGAAATQRR